MGEKYLLFGNAIKLSHGSFLYRAEASASNLEISCFNTYSSHPHTAATFYRKIVWRCLETSCIIGDISVSILRSTW